MTESRAPLKPAIAVVTVRGGVVQDTRANIPLDIIVEDWDDLTGDQPARANLWPDALECDEEAELIRQFGLALPDTDTVSDEQIDGLIDSLLESRRQVAIRWSVEDVKEMRPDLSDSQCWWVLKTCVRRYDAENGVTWALIADVAAQLFGDAPENGEA